MGFAAVNTRNQFEGVVKSILFGPVVSEIVVGTPFGEVVSVVTTSSIRELGLHIGSRVVALVKSTEVSIAKL